MMSRDLDPLQVALIEYVTSIRPDKNKQIADELGKVTAAVVAEGFWAEYVEWRISTYFDTRIEKLDVDGKAWFRVRVECDGQEFICRCPNVEKAFLFAKFYQHLIYKQFYSVGPPWA